MPQRAHTQPGSRGAADPGRLRKGARTRQRIVELAAPVFNQRGYAGASMSALVEATGLEKGGIYNHFGSKEALAVEAFDHAVARIARAFETVQDDTMPAVDRLLAIVRAFARGAREPVLPGGCPIMNTAIESDDTNPALLDRARRAMDSWHRLLGTIVRTGQERGEIDPAVDRRALATLVTATLEGALMLARLYDDPAHMDRAVEHLEVHLESLRRQPSRRTRRKERPT